VPRVLRHLQYAIYRLGMRSPAVRGLLAEAATAAMGESLIRSFVGGEYGAAYGVTARDRAQLAAAFQLNVTAIRSGTSAIQHLAMAREILSVSPEVAGDLIECGTWQGASAASLSLVARLVGRRLLVCDSFSGLPLDGLQPYYDMHRGVGGYLKAGMYAGSLDEVRAHIACYGALDVCEFVPGLFAETLPRLSQPLIFAFLDVDLAESLRDCLRAIWPLLAEGCAVYLDDVGLMELVRVFFDDAWWVEACGEHSPGFVGSGCGLPLMPVASNIGYTRKQGQIDPADWRRDPDLFYPDYME
jgi:O-methyltransferase